MTVIYGGKIGGYWQTYMDYSVSTSNTTVTVTVKMGLYTYANKWIKSGTRKATLSGTGQTSVTKSKSNTKESGGTKYQYCSATWSWSRTTAAQTKTISASIKYTGSDHNGTSSCSASISVPALPKYTITYNANGGTGQPANQSQFIKYGLTLSGTRPTWKTADGTADLYSFLGWTKTKTTPAETPDEAKAITINYQPSSWYNESNTTVSTRTLYAAWVRAWKQPVIETPAIELSGSKKGGTRLQHFTSATATWDDIVLEPLATTATVTLKAVDVDGNEQTVNTVQTSGSGSLTISTIDLSGTVSFYLEIVDDLLKQSYLLLTEQLDSPTFTPLFFIPTAIDNGGIRFEDQLEDPEKDTQGRNQVVISASVWDSDAEDWSSNYVDLGNKWDIITYEYDDGGVTKHGWTLKNGDLSVPQECVDDIDNPNVKLKAVYTTTETNESEARRAFYTTSRNANYNTGLANNVFVGSVDAELYPDYSSRVWYCYVNNPLYFPDLNYIEVGSNDTNVMGMVKVGEYLGIIKQSKATDTSIFLAYATSFEDDTTFAVKQSVSGVGAMGKYCFNVLGDETLFFSPEGIMAIVPSEDDQHKIQLRSYYLNKKLLAENAPETSYSFVFDGYYILAVNGHCYVLDGNQKISWETAKSNLQYEGYYWENVPARFFMTNGDELWFASGDTLCRFKDKTEDFAYNDNGEAIKAEWATIVDDDNAIHYYKTMQKKGNAVSILPCDFKENNIVEVDWYGMYYDPDMKRPIVPDPDPEDPSDWEDVPAEDQYDLKFAENPRKFYTKVKNTYIRCKDGDERDPEVTYYQSTTYTSAKVYVRKDNNDEMYIGMIDGTVEHPNDLPNELFLRKKFKKYKRLQFIIRNEEVDECFGVDSIVKNYTIGNYAKK